MGLSGCQESKSNFKPPTSGDTDKVTLVTCSLETYGSTNNFSADRKQLGDGFIHDDSYNYSYYLLNGTVQNIAPYIIHKLQVVIHLWSSNNSIIATTGAWVYELRRNFTDTFEVKYTSEQPNFMNVTQVTIEFKADRK